MGAWEQVFSGGLLRGVFAIACVCITVVVIGFS